MAKSYSRLHIFNVLQKFDVFGESIPSFNFRGRLKVQTFLGGVCTILIIMVLIAYAAVKMVQLIQK